MLATVAAEGLGAGPADRERDMAFADALDEGARVLMRLSARLRALHAASRSAPSASPAQAPSQATAETVGRAQPLGQRQLAVLGLGGLGEPIGLAASEVAKALGYSPSNAT